MKIALITGAGTGIGRSVALALARQQYGLVLAGRRSDPLDAVAADAADAEDVVSVPTDVGDPRSVAALFATVEERFGRLDLLVNNAGQGAPAVPVDELSFQDWQSIVAANLTGPFLCTQHAFALMKKQDPRGGRIINNGSISAHAPRPYSTPYTATKHAITGLTKSIALDGRPYDIACGQIDIGNAETEMTARMADGVPQADGSYRSEPTMDVDNVADAVLYMASRPLDANVLFLTVMATGMPFVGRG